VRRPYSRPRKASYRSLNANRLTPDAVVAAGYRIDKGQGEVVRRLTQSWERRAFSYYDIVPEIKYAAQFYARALSVLRLYPARIQDDGTIEETDEPAAVDHLERIKDPGGAGREGLLSAYGRLMFLTGQAYLVVTTDQETELEQWEMLSTVEIRPQGDGYVRVRAPGIAQEELKDAPDDSYEPIEDGEAVVYRLFRRHPMFSEISDSTMQGVLDVCEELVLLTQAVRARARSRLAGSGILLVNGKYIPLPAEPENAENPDEDPFMRDLTETMTQPIMDEGAASAVVPHVIRIDADNLDDVMKHIQIIDPMQTYPETGLRMELIKRLAIGLDMPPEVLTGLADSNHWNAWQVDEQTWKAHLQPVANQLVGDLTTAFYQPSLREDGIDDWDRLVIAYDATAVINHPDRSEDAKGLYDRRAIGKKALRDANGFTEEDAPDEEELQEMIGVAVRDGSLALFGIPTVRGGNLEPAPGEIEDASGSDTVPTDAPAAPEKSASVAKEPPASESEMSALVYRIIGGCEVALMRSYELAGNRIRSHVRRDEEATAKINGVSARKVAGVLGLDAATTLKVPATRQLVAGIREILADTLRQWNVDDEYVDALADRIEQHAARELFAERPAPLPPSFTSYVTGIVANGGIRKAA
jgi:hypothetical protein